MKPRKQATARDAKPPFMQRRMPSLSHPSKRVRKRRAAYLRRVDRRVAIMWAGYHDRGLGSRMPKRIASIQTYTETFGEIS